MSFGFRDRVNRDKPRLSDRFRGKSGDEIIKELREDFAKRKQMFFDTSPRTSSSFMKPGFPFDDTSRWRNRGDSDLRHRLDEIAERYPEFADQLRDWTDSESPSGMGWGNKQTSSQPPTPQQSTGQATQAEASTTQSPPPPPQPETQGGEGDARSQRAMSAPPDNRAKDQPQRFVSRLEINPTNASGETVQQQQSQASSQQQNQTQQPQQPQHPQAEPKKKPANVRHIPIFVEGRNEPVIPKDVDRTTTDFGQSFGSPPRERDSRDREDGFHGPAYAKYAPPGFGFPSHFSQRKSPFMRDPFVLHDHMESPLSQHRSEPQPQPHHPQPQHRPHQHHPQQQQPPQPQQQHPHPPQSHPPQQPHPQPQPKPARQPTPPRQPPQPKDPLEEVAAVQKDVEELMKQVEAFSGTRKDKQYIYLDEMLTRNLLKLDLVETEGKENVRAARKETIKCIQKCISILESKTMTPEELAARDKAMEVDETPETQPMEVAEGEAPSAPAEERPQEVPAPAEPAVAASTVAAPAAAEPPAPPTAPAPSTPAPELSDAEPTTATSAPSESPAPEAMETTPAPTPVPESIPTKPATTQETTSLAVPNSGELAQPPAATETTQPASNAPSEGSEPAPAPAAAS